VPFDLDSPPPETIEKAARAIRQGKVVLYPTDTIYGLGCDPFNEKALQRLFAIKGRSEKRGVLILVQDYSYVEVVSDHIPDLFYELVKAFWPGPVTLLLEGNSSCSRLLLGEEGKVGLRHPDLNFLQLWMAAIPGPIVSTSANVSGKPLATLEDLKQLFDHQVDLILESRETEQPSQPSTVVDLTMDPPRIVRVGRWAERVGEFLTRR
jgi:L-threonylcarbamoyladenylate synthase